MLINFVISLIISATDVKRNNYILTIPVMKREFSLQVDFKPMKKTPGWTNLMRLTSVPKNTGAGARIPAIFFHSNTYKLHVCFSINGNSNSCWNSQPLEEKKMVRLSIVQTLQFGKDYRYAISINGKEEYQTGNSKAQEFENVKMYAGDEYYNPAGANIEKIKFQNIGMIFFLCFCFLFIFIYLFIIFFFFRYQKI